VSFKLHHFGLACADLERTSAWYASCLASERIAVGRAPGAETAFIGRGSDVTIELVGPPFGPYGPHHLERPGATSNHLAFEVDDLDRAFAQLRGGRVAWAPRECQELRHFGILDPHGVLLEVFCTRSGAPLGGPAATGPVRLHHVSLLTPDLRRTEQFFRDALHMKTVIEHTENDGGFIFMIDEQFDYHHHNFMLEVIGPPRARVEHATALLEPREQDILARYGSCLDHFCFVADDVRAAHAELVGRGAPSEATPYRDYGSWIGWLKDPNGNDIELMSPIPQSVIEFALESDEPFQSMGLEFDIDNDELGEAMPPPWREAQRENLRAQK
jgi:catechol 2,3-dioxygenase-like lactoylglutathione lyase family enzyme